MHRKRPLALLLFLLGPLALLLPGCAGRVQKRALISAGPLPFAEWERPARLAGVAPATRLDPQVTQATDESALACDDRCDESGGSTSSRIDEGVPKNTRATRVRLEPGMTLYSLSRTYHVPLRTLLQVNEITDPTSIRSGTVIVIPGTRPPAAAPATKRRTARPAKGAPIATPGPPPAGPPAAVRLDPPTVKPDPPAVRLDPPAVRPEPPSQEPATQPGIMSIAWPLEGRITASFGARGQHHHHDGVDIDGVRGEEIRAVAPGVVVRAGLDGKYGRTVVLDHGNGMTTLYAHAHKLYVREGDLVEQGEAIAEVGSTGNARGTHLHFEVRRDGLPVDPLPYLKPEMMGAAAR